MKINIIKYSQVFVFTTAIGLMLWVSGCVDFTSLVHPSTVKANETFNVQINALLEAQGDETITNARFVVAILAPRSWKIGENTTLTYTSVKGSGVLTKIPESLLVESGKTWAKALTDRYGIGPNFNEGLEWVAFYTDKQYNMGKNEKAQVTVDLTIKAGSENTQVKLGYFIGNDRDATSPGIFTKFPQATKYVNCFTVTDGVGDLIDYCNPQISFVKPGAATDNDFINLTIDKELLGQFIAPTPLPIGEDIYLCIKGFTSTDEEFENCVQTSDSKLIKVQGIGGKYDIVIWPRQFLNVPDGKSLHHLEYYFTDASGATKVGFNNTQVPFRYTFNCN